MPLHCPSAALNPQCGLVEQAPVQPTRRWPEKGAHSRPRLSPIPSTYGQWRCHRGLAPRAQDLQQRRKDRGRSQAELCGLLEALGQHSQRRRGGGAAGGGARSRLRGTSSNPAAAVWTWDQQAALGSLLLHLLVRGMEALVATDRAVAKASVTLGRETPCKLLSALALGIAINDSPTPGYHGYHDLCPAHLDPGLLQGFNPACLGTLPGASPALFPSLMAFSREAGVSL